MILRFATALAAGLTGFGGAAAVACTPAPSCVYTPASPAYAVAPAQYGPYGANRYSQGYRYAAPYPGPAYGDACDVCAPPAPIPPPPQPVFEEASGDIELTGGVGGDIGGGGGGGGGGNSGSQFEGFAATEEVANGLASAYAASQARAGAQASASATATASASAQSSSWSKSRGGGKGWGGWSGGVGGHGWGGHKGGCGCSNSGGGWSGHGGHGGGGHK